MLSGSENGGPTYGTKSKFLVDHDINAKLYLWRGTPWALEVDAVVNSSNEVNCALFHSKLEGSKICRDRVEVILQVFTATFLTSILPFNLLLMMNRMWMKHIAVLACTQQLDPGLQRNVQLW